MGRAEGVPLPAPLDAGTPSRGSALGKRVLSTVLLLPAFLWIVIFAPPWGFTAVILGVAAVAQWEFARMFQRAGVPVFTALGLAGGLAVTASFLVREAMPAALSLVVGAVLVAGLAGRGTPARSREAAGVTLLGIGYVNWLLGHVLWLRALPAGADWVLLLVWVTWIGETAAYLVGSCLGRHRLAPRISPGKTVEGALAQLLISPLAALAALAWLFPQRPAWEAAVIGIALGVAGQAGDLAESLLKRSAGTKDTGAIIPGHGGMLDRVDGLLFNAPVLFYYAAHARGLGS